MDDAATNGGRSDIPHRDLKQTISEHPRGGAGTYDGPGSALFSLTLSRTGKAEASSALPFVPCLISIG